MLFIFVSIHKPNPLPNIRGSIAGMFILLCAFLCLFSFAFFSFPSLGDESFFLCSFFEGVSYCLFCLVLMLGFICVRVVVRNKSLFFR